MPISSGRERELADEEEQQDRERAMFEKKFDDPVVAAMLRRYRWPADVPEARRDLAPHATAPLAVLVDLPLRLLARGAGSRP